MCSLSLIVAETLAIPVRIVNDSAGTSWHDFVTPLFTFLGGIAAIGLGAKLTRRTLTHIEDDKAKRETALEGRREARELATEMRLAAGISRVLLARLQTSKNVITTSIDHRMWWPDGITCAVDLRSDDEHRLAAHFQEEAWEIVALCRDALTILDSQHAYNIRARQPMTGDPTQGLAVEPEKLTPILATIENAQVVVGQQLVRLRAGGDLPRDS